MPLNKETKPNQIKLKTLTAINKILFMLSSVQILNKLSGIYTLSTMESCNIRKWLYKMLYSRERKQCWYMKNIICFFSNPFLSRYVCTGRVRESRKMAKMHTHRVLFSETFLLCSAQVEIFPALYHFPNPRGHFYHLHISGGLASF